MSRRLPDGAELNRQRTLPPERRPTLEEIGKRYGTSRQAVSQALNRWRAAHPDWTAQVGTRKPNGD